MKQAREAAALKGERVAALPFLFCKEGKMPRARYYPALYKEDTAEIIPAGKNLAVLAKIYGVDPSGLSKVILGKRKSVGSIRLATQEDIDND
jgi:hypothetical protein